MIILLAATISTSGPASIVAEQLRRPGSVPAVVRHPMPSSSALSVLAGGGWLSSTINRIIKCDEFMIDFLEKSIVEGKESIAKDEAYILTLPAGPNRDASMELLRARREFVEVCEGSKPRIQARHQELSRLAHELATGVREVKPPGPSGAAVTELYEKIKRERKPQQ